jgi:glyoxylase-like metal-dependent hydrolase (beta-lactamase superfamily II)
MAHAHDYLPLPAQALPEDDGPDGYRLQKAGENGYVVIVGFVQSVFVVTDDGVVVVDAPPSHIDKLPAAIRSVTNKPVTHFIYTHSHWDHVGGVSQFPDATRIAHEEAARLLRFTTTPHDPCRRRPSTATTRASSSAVSRSSCSTQARTTKSATSSSTFPTRSSRSSPTS